MVVVVFRIRRVFRVGIRVEARARRTPRKSSSPQNASPLPGRGGGANRAPHSLLCSRNHAPSRKKNRRKISPSSCSTMIIHSPSFSTDAPLGMAVSSRRRARGSDCSMVRRRSFSSAARSASRADCDRAAAAGAIGAPDARGPRPPPPGTRAGGVQSRQPPPAPSPRPAGAALVVRGRGVGDAAGSRSASRGARERAGERPPERGQEQRDAEPEERERRRRRDGVRRDGRRLRADDADERTLDGVRHLDVGRERVERGARQVLRGGLRDGARTARPRGRRRRRTRAAWAGRGRRRRT